LPKSILFGLLICGKCGFRMTVTKNHGQRYYHCSRYHEYGKEACDVNAIKEEKLLRCIARKIQEVFLNPDNLEKLRAEIRAQLQKQGADNPKALDKMRKRRRELDTWIEQAAGRMFLIPEDVMV